MLEGCRGFVVKREGDRMLLAERYKGGDAVPAGTPLLVQGTDGTYSIYGKY